MTTAFIGMGSNLGASASLLQQVADELKTHPNIHNVTLSSLYQSAPVLASGPDYINAVAQINTDLTALELLDVLQSKEHEHGRTRPYHNAPRTLDLDLLLFGTQNINHDRLQVPHPRMHLRAFVLLPLHELAPNLDIAQQNIVELIKSCGDQQISKL